LYSTFRATENLSAPVARARLDVEIFLKHTPLEKARAMGEIFLFFRAPSSCPWFPERSLIDQKRR